MLPTYHAPPPHPNPNPNPNPDQVRALAREKRIELPHVLKEIDASPGALRALRRRVRASLLIPPYTPLPPLTPPYTPLHPWGALRALCRMVRRADKCDASSARPSCRG